MAVLNQTAFLFPDKILGMLRLHDELYIKDPFTMEDILYFEQVKRHRLWESFRLMNFKGDLLMLFKVKYWAFRPKIRMYTSESSDNFAKDSKINENLLFLGELKGRIWTWRPNYWFERLDGVHQFNLIGNLRRNRFKFENLMQDGPTLMAEADREFFNIPGYMGLRIYPGIDKLTRAIILSSIIAVIRYIRTTLG